MSKLRSVSAHTHTHTRVLVLSTDTLPRMLASSKLTLSIVRCKSGGLAPAVVLYIHTIHTHTFTSVLSSLLPEGTVHFTALVPSANPQHPFNCLSYYTYSSITLSSRNQKCLQCKHHITVAICPSSSVCECVCVYLGAS